MPRNYKTKKYKKPDHKIVEMAREALKTSSFRKVSKDVNIPKSTLLRWQQNPNISIGAGRPPILTAAEEDLIVNALLYTAKCGFPQNREWLKDMVQSFVKHIGRKSTFLKDRPGIDWIVLFEKRNHARLTKRKPEILSTSGAKGLTRTNVANFYKMYEDTLKEYNLIDKPWIIFNLGGTGLTGGTTYSMVYVGKEIKNAYSLNPPGSKTMYTNSTAYTSQGSRSTVKPIINNMLCTPENEESSTAIEIKTRKRTRVQAQHEDVLKRLSEEEVNKKYKKSNKPGIFMPMTKKNGPQSSGENGLDSRDIQEMTDKVVWIKELKPYESYVIVFYEGLHFPGLVVRLSKSKVRVKCMQKSGLNTWKWPAQDDLDDYTINNVIKVIQNPSVASRQGDYYVPDVDDYWKILPNVISPQ